MLGGVARRSVLIWEFSGTKPMTSDDLAFIFVFKGLQKAKYVLVIVLPVYFCRVVAVYFPILTWLSIDGHCYRLHATNVTHTPRIYLPIDLPRVKRISDVGGHVDIRSRPNGSRQRKTAAAPYPPSLVCQSRSAQSR
jgi:hypothetical protein